MPALANVNDVEDPLTGELIPQEELDYRTQLRESIAAGELGAQPLPDGSWEISVTPEERGPPPMDEDAPFFKPEMPGGIWDIQARGFRLEGEGQPIPIQERINQARQRLKRFGIPEEFWRIADDYVVDKTGGAYYDPNRNVAATNEYNPRDAFAQNTPIHEALHAFEYNLTPEELGELNELIAQNPPPEGGPTRHHPPGGKDIYGGTGLPAYFDYIFANFGEEGKVNEKPTPVPAPIIRFIQEKSKEIAARRDAIDAGRRSIPQGDEIGTGLPGYVDKDPLFDLRREMTGESNPETQQALLSALSDLPQQKRRELLFFYKEGIGPAYNFTREEAWKRMLQMAPEVLKGNVSQPAFEAFLDKAAAKIFDPITATGEAVLGRERYQEVVPDPFKTAFQWAPILVAPQKGIIKDLVFGGAGPKLGAFAIGGAVVGEQVAKLTGAPEFPVEFAGALLAPSTLGRRWLAVEQALRNAKVNLDEGITDDIARALNDDQDFVRGAQPDDMVTVYHGTSEAAADSIRAGGLDVGGALTTDPEVALLHALNNGMSNPTVLAFQVPRKALATKEWYFTARQALTPVADSVQSRFFPNVQKLMREFLRDETGSFRLSAFFEDPPLDPRAAELIGTREVDEFADETLEETAKRISKRSALAGAMYDIEQLQGGQMFGGVEVVKKGGHIFVDGKQRSLEEAAAEIQRYRVIKIYDVEEILELHGRARARNWDDDTLREQYLQERRFTAETQDELDALPPDADEAKQRMLREQLYTKLHFVQVYGEELARRTGGKEGVVPHIKRMFDQFLAEEEGAIRIPNLGPGTPTQRVTWQPATAAVKLFGLRPVVPRLSKTQKLFNIFKYTTRLGMPDDPLGSAVIRERGLAMATAESQANHAASKLEYLSHRYFPADKNNLIKGLPGNPTIQDLAAKLPAYAPLLKPEQLAALERMREMIRPYHEAMVSQGVDLGHRSDVVEGGFYLPRGRADVEGAIDLPKTGPRGGGVRKGFERKAKFVPGAGPDLPESMADAIALGYRYDDFGTVMNVYFMDAGTKTVDSYLSNVLKTATDDAGVPLGSTPHARLLKQNEKLALQIGTLRKALASLSNSVEGLDKRIHGRFALFLYSPAPDLNDLRLALNKLSTKKGSLRVRMAEGERQTAFRELRREVNEEVFRNRGRYKGLTGEQARKQALKDALEKIRIRRGRFKGLSFEEGDDLLKRVKATVAGMENEWQDALDLARQTPRGELELDRRAFGSYLQGTSFDEGLASTINKYFRGQGPPEGLLRGVLVNAIAVNTLLRGLRATADLSAMGIQGLIGLAHEPNAYRHALQGSLRAMFDPINGRYVLGKFLDDFDRASVRQGLPTASEWAAAGIRFGGIDTEFIIGNRLGQGIGNLPVIRQANRSFGYFGDILRLDGAQSQFDIKKLGNMLPAQRQQAMKEIANAQNLMTGWSPGRVGGDLGSFALFAPRFFQSQLEMVVRAVGDRSLTGNQARLGLLKLIGLGTLLTFAANEQLDNRGFDYSSPIVNGRFNPNFMRIRYGGRDYSLFGPWDSLLRAIVMAVQKGDPFYLLRSKASPLITTGWDTITGEDFIGRKAPRIKKLVEDSIGELRSAALGTEYESSGDWGLMPEYFLRSVLPFSLADPVSEVATGKKTVGEAVQSDIAAVTGLKSAPLSLAEERDLLRRKVVDEIIRKGGLPDYMIPVFKQTPYFEMSSTEKKLIDKYIEENYPDEEQKYRSGRREEENIFQIVRDQADGHREVIRKDYDKLMEMLLAGEQPKVIWEAYDDARNQLAGRLAGLYEGGINPRTGEVSAAKETKTYQEEVEKLRPSDIRRIEDAWNGIITDYETGPNIFDWDKIEAKRVRFLEGLQDVNPDLARRFVYSLGLKEEMDLEESHPLVQLKKVANTALQPYYALKDQEAPAEELTAWLNENPDADFAMWLTASWEDPTIHSVTAAARAFELAGEKRNIRLPSMEETITKANLPILQEYDKEITRLITLPGSALDIRGREYSPRTELRKRDPLYDALYFRFFADGGLDNTAVVYHLGAVLEYLRRWGPRQDGVRPRLSR